MRRERLFLDANVLVSARVRDLLLRVAEAGLVEVCWSQPVLAETRRTLIERLAVDTDRADRLLAHLAAAFPEALIEGFEWRVDALVLPDADDRHVAAAAIHGECDGIVTNNTKDFPESILAMHDLAVMNADECLVWLVQFADRLAPILDQQIADLRHPPSSVVDFLEQLRRDAPHGAVILGAVLRYDRYRALVPDLLDAVDPASPQSAIQDLLAVAMDAQPPADLLDRIDPDFAIRAGRYLPWEPRVIHDALRADLAEVVDAPSTFGIGSAKRIVDLDVEVVALFRRSAERTPYEPAPYLVMVMRLSDDRWRLVAIDRPPLAVR